MLPVSYRAILALILAGALAACAGPSGIGRQPATASASSAAGEQVAPPPRLTPRQAKENFVTVAQTMEPVIRRECISRSRGREKCNYHILVTGQGDPTPNAFQTLDDSDEPVICFNYALIGEARDPDELAFVMGHEAAHHILGHLREKEEDAEAGALIMAVVAASLGAGPDEIADAQDAGAAIGGRAYSQDYELQADRLGTVITWDAGYDPIRGAQFFARLPDPGPTFLGSHPPNEERLALVKETVAELKAGKLR